MVNSIRRGIDTRWRSATVDQSSPLTSGGRFAPYPIGLARQLKQSYAKEVEQLHRDIAAYQQRAPATRPVQAEQSRQPNRGPSRER